VASGTDRTEALADAVRAAAGAGAPLSIVGGGTKGFYGRAPEGAPLDVAGHRGIVRHEPTELLLTARAGTPLSEIEGALSRAGQMLPFEPPAFGPRATLGGTVACNLSGPRRAYAGAARDFVLGTRVLTGRGEVLRFGGEVMKNVAGYDVSRLMTGALGTLGVLLEISLRVLPRPEAEVTLVREASAAEALERMHAWGARPLPVSATCHVGDRLYVRLSGTEAGVAAARGDIGGDPLPDGSAFWTSVREQTHPFFADGRPLWRLSLRSDAPPLELHGDWLYEWGGALRWRIGEADGAAVRGAARALGGHATRFKGHGGADDVFTEPPAPVLALHRRLKAAFDPGGVLNPGRMYAGV
jgi:glycolate oxidase FAD binding subunit